MLFSITLLTVVSAATPVDYGRDIKPILQERCYACHGALSQKAGLRVDSVKGMTVGAKRDPVVVAGSLDESSLFERISSADDSIRMPPEGIPLKPEQVAKIKLWIEQGAVAPANDKPEADPRDHWAFRKPVRPATPITRVPAQNPIDAFIRAEQEKHNLQPVAKADPRVLLRRLYLDLIGMPPSEVEVESFLRDPSSQAYAKRVEELLASPHYGERWGRHFLDIWRYSDWWGLGAEVRNSQKHMWHWRDWVIESFNSDLGYDEMIRRMLAGDELYPNDLSQLRATGYLARQYFKFNRNSWLDETVEHTSKAFLGLTWNCARCHDHKFDPITQTDYYRFRAFFEPYQVRMEILPGQLDIEQDGLPRAFDCNHERPTFLFIRGDEKQPVKDKPLSPGVPQFLSTGELPISPRSLPAEAYLPQLRQHVIDAHLKLAEADGELGIAAVRARLEADRLQATGTEAEAKEAAKRAATAEKRLALAKAESAFQKAESALRKGTGYHRISLAIVHRKAESARESAKKALSNPGETYTSLRGAIKTLESNVETEASRSKPFPKTSTGRRTALANWIASNDNPLTARVAVNHLWSRHFGKPLVPTVFDFGRKGIAPSHPELLDWLALELMEHQWSFKHLHRMMVTSDVYRLSAATADAHPATREADSDNRYYWHFNPVRMDAPTIRDSLLSLAGELDRTLGGPAIPVAQQEQSRRRSVYFFHSHNEYDKFQSIFDDANVLECYRRTESIVPQQALALSNSPFAMKKASQITMRLSTPFSSSDASFVDRAFHNILGSTPTDEERTACLEAMTEWKLLASGTESDRTQRARLNLVQTLLNHNDFVTIR